MKVGDNLAPFNPTSVEVIDIVLSLLQLIDQDCFYDLGCGDARVLIAAKKLVPAIRAVGIEYDHELFQRAQNEIRKAFTFTIPSTDTTNPSSSASLTSESADISSNSSNVDVGIRVIHADVQVVDFSDGSAFFIYLVPKGIAALRPMLIKALERGARIVTYVFSIPDLIPSKMEVYKGITKIYLYTMN